MTDLEQGVLAQLESAGAAGRSHREVAQALGADVEQVWIALAALMLTGKVCRRDVGRETVWSMVKEAAAALASVSVRPTATQATEVVAAMAQQVPQAVVVAATTAQQVSVPQQVAQLLQAAGAAGLTSTDLVASVAGKKGAVHVALQFHKNKGNVLHQGLKWVWQAEGKTAPAVEINRTEENTMTPSQPAAEPMPFNCLLDADGHLHLDLENGETLRLTTGDTRKLANFLKLVTPALEALPA